MSSLRIMRASLWFLLLIIETMILSLDALALWTAALLTSLLLRLFPDLGLHGQLYPSVIFLVLSMICLLITRWYVLPMIKKHPKPHALGIDALIGQHLIVQEQNDMQVVFREGKYRPIKEHHDHPVHIHHKIEVLSVDGNNLIVKKL